MMIGASLYTIKYLLVIIVMQALKKKLSNVSQETISN